MSVACADLRSLDNFMWWRATHFFSQHSVHERHIHRIDMPNFWWTISSFLWFLSHCVIFRFVVLISCAVKGVHMSVMSMDGVLSRTPTSMIYLLGPFYGQRVLGKSYYQFMLLKHWSSNYYLYSCLFSSLYLVSKPSSDISTLFLTLHCIRRTNQMSVFFA